MKNAFRKISARVSAITGSAGAFLLALLLVTAWAVTGPYFNYSNTWQLIINTCTTIGTFLMVFLIQNTQNRDSKAMQLKLDELIRGSSRARDSFMDLEDMTDDELEALDNEFRGLHERQASTPSMHKLHGKIAAEHHRRKSVKSTAGQILEGLHNFRKEK